MFFSLIARGLWQAWGVAPKLCGGGEVVASDHLGDDIFGEAHGLAGTIQGHLTILSDRKNVLAIIREDLLQRSSKSLHTMLNYAVHAENGSMYNTPPCFGIYLMGLVMKWAIAEGGLVAVGARNERKASKLYAEIDRTGFYRGHAEKGSRSRMNITFRLPSEELESKFVKESTAAGLDGLKGHRSVGGLRASIYNAFPEEGIDALVSFMQEFERKNG